MGLWLPAAILQSYGHLHYALMIVSDWLLI